jgi:heterodisulfide reductase subunit B
VFYFTQLLGLAMGCGPDELSLASLIVAPQALLEAKGIGR